MRVRRETPVARFKVVRATIMGSTQSRTCAACGGRHELFVPDDISETRKPHGFTCPATSEVVKLDRSIIGWWKTVSSKPPDAVVVREI